MTRARAFTLIEMLLVLVITAVVVAAAVPNFSKSFGGFHLRQASDDVKNRTRWAQAMAMSQQRVYLLTFAADNRCYTVTRSKEQGVTKDPVFERLEGTAGKKHCLPDRTTFVADPTAIKIYPDGTMDPAEIKLSNGTRSLTLSSKAKRGALVVYHDE